jgi:hypothetical protein
MSPEGYTEDRLVEQPAIELFAELGWATVSASEESFGSAEPSPQHSPRGRWSWLGDKSWVGGAAAREGRRNESLRLFTLFDKFTYA